MTVYVRLLDEGVPVMRPTLAEEVGDGVFVLLPTDDYDPIDERWEFSPGATVRCSTILKDGKHILVAEGRVDQTRDV